MCNQLDKLAFMAGAQTYEVVEVPVRKLLASGSKDYCMGYVKAMAECHAGNNYAVYLNSLEVWPKWGRERDWVST